MSGPGELPSEEQENANAAYLLRVSVQADLVNFANDRAAKPESVKWHFERYWKAVEREREAEAIVKASLETRN